MAWVRIDDRFDEHPKVMAAGHEAMWLLLRALAFANRGETDGHIPAVALSRIGSEFGPKKRQSLVRTLVDVELMHCPGHDCNRCPQPSDGWQIHDYADYQPTRKQKDAERAEARERMAKVRAKKKPRSADVRTEHDTNRNRSSDYPVPVPVPQDAGSSDPVENGIGGVQGGNAEYKQTVRTVAEEHADRRISEGYEVRNREAFIRDLAKSPEVRNEAMKRTRAPANVLELLEGIGRPIDGQEAAG